MKMFIAFLFYVASLVLAVNAIHEGISVNWDVPEARITAHQGWTAAWAFFIPAIPAFMCFVLAVILHDSYGRNHQRGKLR